MSNDIYDVLKMHQDKAENLVKDASLYLSSTNNFNTEMKASLEESKEKLNANKALLKTLGISFSDEDDTLSFGKEQRIDELLDNINQSKISYEEEEVSFEDLVETAHSKGYTDTTIQELLTEDEIKKADIRFDSIESAFKEKTKLSNLDIKFLATAVALQVLRQYVLDPYLKNQRLKAGNNDESTKRKENREPGWYRVATDKILSSKVPFDAIRYSDNASIKGFLSGQKNHRDVTLGHDPMLGWFFGTANIMTGTITNSKFNSAHVKYVPGKGNIIHSRAETTRVFSTIIDRISTEGNDGKKALVYSIAREAIHLKSDVGTKHSLPLPGVSVISPKLCSNLMEYGIDIASVGTEMMFSQLINFIIAIIHGIIKPVNEDNDLYKVKTRKILLISNMIASSSNVVAVGIGTAVGTVSKNPDTVKKSINYLDVGGLLVTISRLFSDIRFISRIKKEFIESKLDEQLIEELNNLDKYY